MHSEASNTLHGFAKSNFSNIKNWQRPCFCLRKNVWNCVIFIEPCCGRQVICWFAWTTTKNILLSLELGFSFFFFKLDGRKAALMGVLALFNTLDGKWLSTATFPPLYLEIMKEGIHFVHFPQWCAKQWGKRRKLSQCCLLFLPLWLTGDHVCLCLLKFS